MFGHLRAVIKDSRGVAAIEFALIVPIMAVILIGIYQVSQAVRVNMKLSNVAVAVADLVSQQSAGVSGSTSGSLGNFCKAAQLMMAPFPTGAATGPFSLSIASVTNYSNNLNGSSNPGTIKVDWEVDGACSIVGTNMGTSAITLVTSPVNLLANSGPDNSTNIAGDTVIVVQASYSYHSLVQMLAPSIASQTKTGFARPRSNTVIPCTASCS